MTHDAMWFYHSFNEVGIEKTNKINKAAVRSMAAIEVQRFKKALGYGDESINNYAGLKSFFSEMFEVVKAGFMKGDMEFPPPNILRLTWQQCFAYNGINKMGIIEQYQCGIFDRIEGWFDGLGLKYEVTPKIDGCMMHTEGKCHRDYIILFK